MINIKVDQQRFADMVKVDEWLALYENEPKAMVNILSRFVLDDNGVYLDFAEGRKLVGTLTLTQLRDAAAAFIGNAQEAAVPKASAAI